MKTRHPTRQEATLIDHVCDDVYDIAEEKQFLPSMVSRDQLIIRISSRYGDPDDTGICGFTDIFGIVYLHPKILVWEIGFAVNVIAHEIVHAKQYETTWGMLWARTFGRWKAECQANNIANEIYRTWTSRGYILKYHFGYNL